MDVCRRYFFKLRPFLNNLDINNVTNEWIEHIDYKRKEDIMERNKTVSLCMIVKNEERYLGKCLESVKDLVDEMIIVDTGSTDKTVEIAKKMGASVYHYEWDNDFSKARNYSLSHAKMDWILLMDGDDAFCREDRDKYITLVNSSKKDGHFFKTLSYVGDLPGKDVVMNLNLRLINNNKGYCFKGAIHEQIICNNQPTDYSKFSSEDIRVFHYGYLLKVISEKNKRKRNIEIIQSELEKDPNNHFHIFNLGNEYFALGDIDKALVMFNKIYPTLKYNLGYSSKLVIRRIMCLFELRLFDKALEAIDEGLKIYCEFTDLEYIRGLIYFTSKKYTIAMDSFKNCITMGKPPIQIEFLEGCGTYRPYEVLGRMHFEMGEYERALDNYKKVIFYNPKLLNILYKIGTCLNILYDNKEYVAFKLSQYFNLEHIPNLLLISNILMKEKLYNLALGYVEKAREYDQNDTKSLFMKGKILFYLRKYREAKKIFIKFSMDSIEYKESGKYIFIINLLAKEIEKTEDYKILIEGDSLENRIYRQLYSIYKDNLEVVLLQEDNQEKILDIVITIFDELLKVKEFSLFEKLLGILNHINSDRILLQLAKVYYNQGFGSLAVKEILRSIKELNTIDYETVKILYKELG